jgi:hypothetical protein
MTVNLVSEGERTDPYTFTAASLREALQRMAQLGDRDGDGNHSASIDIRADIFQNLQTGIISGSTTQIQGMGWTSTALITQGSLRYGFIFRFPRWSNVGNLSRPIQSEWQRYTRCLWTHERGHAREAMPVLQQYLRQFQELRIASMGASSREAEEAAQRELRSHVTDVFSLLRHDNEESIRRYDRRTRHGRNQGAQLRVSLPRGSRH